MNAPLAFLGRLLLATLFLVAGVRKVFGFQGIVHLMTAKGLPYAEMLLMLAILLEIGGGLMLIVSWHARTAAVALAIFTLAAGALFHDFWVHLGGDAAQFSNQLNHALKNIAIAGGLLHVAATPRQPAVTASPEA